MQDATIKDIKDSYSKRANINYITDIMHCRIFGCHMHPVNTRKRNVTTTFMPQQVWLVKYDRVKKITVCHLMRVCSIGHQPTYIPKTNTTTKKGNKTYQKNRKCNIFGYFYLFLVAMSAVPINTHD